MFRLARNREDAEDLTQITFLNAYAAMQRGAEPEAPRAWLYAIARNAGSRRFRQSRLVEVELDPETPAPLGKDVTVHELQAALARLTLNQRASLLMREVGGLSAKEIGARLGISPGAVATLLFRARRALRAELEGLEPPTEGSRLGGLAVLSAALRPVLLRLLGPVLDGSEVLSRSAAVAGLAAATAGVAVFTTTAVPRPARAEHAHAVRAAAPAKVVLPRVHGRAVVQVQRVSIPTAVRGTSRIAAAQPLGARDAAAQRPAAPSARSSPVHVSRSDPVPEAPAAAEQAAAPPPAPAAEPESSPSPQPAREHVEDPPPDAQSATQSLVTTASQAVPAYSPSRFFAFCTDGSAAFVFASGRARTTTEAGFAAIVISSPVAGLRPLRAFVAALSLTVSWTMLPTFTFSAFAISSSTTSSSAVSARLASARVRSARSATASAS